MGRKPLFRLRAKLVDGKVTLTFFKSTPYFKQDNNYNWQIRIYKMETPEFQWGRDYEEYFDGLGHKDAKIIHSHSLPTINDRKYEYVDEDVSPRKTYVYWVSADDAPIPTGPVAVRVRDNKVWWPKLAIDNFMRNLQTSYPDKVSFKQFGYTTKNIPINGIVIGNQDKLVSFVGTLHAGESGPELLLPVAKRLLEEENFLFDSVGIAILPSVNIDQRELLVNGYPCYLRTNPNGVDLNRNFDADWNNISYKYGQISTDPEASTYRGPFPESERETQTVKNFIEETKPTLSFSFHWLASICGACFLVSKHAETDKQFADYCKRYLTLYSKPFFEKPEPELQFHFRSSEGSLSSWCYLEKGIPSFDLEFDGNERASVSAFDKTTPELIEEYKDKHYHGILALLKQLTREN